MPDMPYSQRPHVMTVYAPEVDQAGHGSGPDSNEVKSELRKMDTFIGEVFDQIDQRNLTDVVDVIVVSDHGMAGTSWALLSRCRAKESDRNCDSSFARQQRRATSA